MHARAYTHRLDKNAAYSDVATTVADVNYELCCQMHNLGALHAQVAVNEARISLEVGC